MFSPPRNSERICTVRRITAIAVLLSYALGQGYIPLPLSAAKTDSTPFPCQHHACGCVSAAQCWRSCCCFTHEQKIAWAEAHHVPVPQELIETGLIETRLIDNPELAPPPEFIVKVPQLPKSETTSPLKTSSPKKQSCCSSKSGHCSQKHSQSAEPKPAQDCCSRKHVSQQPQQSPSEDSDVISLTDYLGCHGLQMFWVTTPPTTPDRFFTCNISLARSFECCLPGDDLLVAATLSPPIPPPRIA